ARSIAGAPRVHARKNGASFEGVWWRNTEQIEDGRREIDQPDGSIEGPRGEAGRPDDPRHAQRHIVGEYAVRPLPVLAEALAMIGGDDDERAIELTGGFQVAEETAEGGVGVGDFGVVRRVLRSVRLRRAIRLVRVVQM